MPRSVIPSTGVIMASCCDDYLHESNAPAPGANPNATTNVIATIRIMTHSSALTCELMLLKLRNASFIVIARVLLISTEARSSVKCRKSEAKEGWTCDWTKDARYPTTRLNGDGYCSCE